MKWFFCLCCCTLNLLAADKAQVRLTGYQPDVNAVNREILAPAGLAADASTPWVAPEEYRRFAVVYIGELLKGLPAEALWSGEKEINAVREYVGNGGIVILSGGAVNGLAGEGRNLEKIRELTGFAGTARLNREKCEGFKFVSTGQLLSWQPVANDIAVKPASAEILGVFVADGKEYPAATVNRIGKGKVFWISPLFGRLRDYYRKNNKSLGSADDEGRFILTPEGETLEELRKLYLRLFLEAPGLRQAAARTETPAWDPKPLGPKGNLEYPQAQFRNQPVFREPPRRSPGMALYGNGEPAVIVVPPGSDKQTQALACELAYHLNQMTGAEFEITGQAPAGRNALVFGDAAAAAEFGVDYSRLQPQTAILLRKGNRLLIGGRDNGASFALTYLLESLGCRYLWPGKSGKVIPRRTELVLPEISLNSTPELKIRGVRNPSALNERWASALKRCGIDPKEFDRDYRNAAVDHPGNRDFYHWHGVNQGQRTAGFGHAFGDFYERFGKTHPEYFALQPDGSRSQEAGPDRARLCKSNPELIRLVAEEKIAELRKNPAADCVSICPNDGSRNNFCMCEACRLLDPVNAAPIDLLVFRGRNRENVKYAALTDRILTFSNRIAEQVTAVLPDKKLGIYVYSYYGRPPVSVKPHPALLLAATNGAYTNEQARGTAMKDLAAWSSFGNPMIWRPNALYGFHRILMPQNYAEKLFMDLETLKANGFIGTDFDCNELLWSTKGLIYYTLAKALWNPDRLDFDTYFRDYCQSGFGAAAPEIMQYFKLLEKTCNRAAEEAADLGEFFDEPLIADLQGRLDAARALAAGNAAVLERIEFLQTGLDAGKLNRALHQAKKGKSPEYQKLQERFMEFLRANARKNPVAMNPMYTGFYNQFIK